MAREFIAWRSEKRAGESVFIGEAAGVKAYFGCGPRFGEPHAVSRLEAFLESIEDLKAIRCGIQVHGNLIASLSEEPRSPFEGVAEVGRCDGMITDTPGLGLALWTADCVPVLMSGGGVVAAVHAGWRGIAAGIHSRAVRRFFIEYGVVASELQVFLGPSVGPCHYEVGAEVIKALGAEGVSPEFWLEGRRVHLRGLLKTSFEALGVDPDAIELFGPCTACDENYASYRRDHAEAGRQFSIIALRG